MKPFITPTEVDWVPEEWESDPEPDSAEGSEPTQQPDINERDLQKQIVLDDGEDPPTKEDASQVRVSSFGRRIREPRRLGQ